MTPDSSASLKRRSGNWLRAAARDKPLESEARKFFPNYQECIACLRERWRGSILTWWGVSSLFFLTLTAGRLPHLDGFISLFSFHSRFRALQFPLPSKHVYKSIYPVSALEQGAGISPGAAQHCMWLLRHGLNAEHPNDCMRPRNIRLRLFLIDKSFEFFVNVIYLKVVFLEARTRYSVYNYVKLKRSSDDCWVLYGGENAKAVISDSTLTWTTVRPHVYHISGAILKLCSCGIF